MNVPRWRCQQVLITLSAKYYTIAEESFDAYHLFTFIFTERSAGYAAPDFRAQLSRIFAGSAYSPPPPPPAAVTRSVAAACAKATERETKSAVQPQKCQNACSLTYYALRRFHIAQFHLYCRPRASSYAAYGARGEFLSE